MSNDDTTAEQRRSDLQLMTAMAVDSDSRSTSQELSDGFSGEELGNFLTSLKSEKDQRVQRLEE